ncbi:hypothetical protein WA026_006773 [Henosepilachna vigintioctopunctata]|uniref:WD repeat-containing protein 55 homolog n=1 Tax=Henosepilachna vigintioctopunctata TaxID=420089 RepID=A0AAW1UAQ3_9CUCU
MCPTKKQYNMNDSAGTHFEDSDEYEGNSSTSDVSMTDSESDEDEIDEENVTEEAGGDEEEDEIIKAIRQASNKKRDHPPPVYLEDDVTDLSFHPKEDIIAISNVVGDVSLYKYTNEENTLLGIMEVHTSSCRDIEFSENGKTLFSVSSDKAIMLSNVETQNLVRFYEGAHDHPISCISVLDENLFCTGDDEGSIKLWDLRINSDTQIYKAKKHEDYISDILTNDSKTHLLCSSGDGSLTTFDLQNRKFLVQTEEYEEELTCLGLFRRESKLISGTSKGKLLLFNWGEFGLHSDIFPGPKTCINAMIPITENVVVTACDDGILRATHLCPHRHLGIVGKHNFPVENVDICTDGRFIASSSHNSDVQFWNIEYFRDYDKVSNKHKKHERKKDLLNNLPSSKYANASDFFSGLA